MDLSPLSVPCVTWCNVTAVNCGFLTLEDFSSFSYLEGKIYPMVPALQQIPKLEISLHLAWLKPTKDHRNSISTTSVQSIICSTVRLSFGLCRLKLTFNFSTRAASDNEISKSTPRTKREMNKQRIYCALV